MKALKVGDFVVPKGTRQHWLIVLVRYVLGQPPRYVCFRDGVRATFAAEAVK